jgi:SAM-dependent methyltransferase
MADKKHGDFTGLAGNYSKYRPTYSESVLTALLSLVNKPIADIDAADVGAGTGIWSRMLAQRGCRTVVAVEPNDDMRAAGIKDSTDLAIEWSQGTGERTGLEDQSKDALSMASSFHWVDFEQGLEEFSRILRPQGRFAALWNPRYIEANPLLVEIENKLQSFAPHLKDLKRVSSGRSGITDTLTERLQASPLFDDVVYLEGRHVVRQTPAQYIGVWWSVNDIRVQAGEEAFQNFMDYVTQRVQGLEFIETTYLTRAWSAARI